MLWNERRMVSNLSEKRGYNAKNPSMRRLTYWFLLSFWIAAELVGCDYEKNQTKLVYFGFDDNSEKTEDTIQLAKTWGGSSPPCPHWRATINKKTRTTKYCLVARWKLRK